MKVRTQDPRRGASLLWLLALTALFVATRLPSLGLGWYAGEPSFLVGRGGAPLEQLSRWLVMSLGEPFAPGPVRLVGLGLGLLCALAFGRLMRRLIGRRTGPLVERVTVLLVALVPFLDSWMLDVRHLGNLAALGLLALAGERVLTWKLRGGLWRLGLGLAALAGASLAEPLAWIAGPFLIALALFSYLNPESPRWALRRRHGMVAASGVLAVWTLVFLGQAQLASPLLPELSSSGLSTSFLEQVPRTKAVHDPASLVQMILLLGFLLVPVQLVARERGVGWLRPWWAPALVAASVLLRGGEVVGPAGAMALALLIAPALGELLSARPGRSRSWARGRVFGLLAGRGLAVALLGVLAWDHATGLVRALHLDAHSRSIVAAIEGPVWAEAQAGSNSMVLLLRSGGLDPGGPPDQLGTGLGRDLPLVMAPPFRSGTIPVQLVDVGGAGLSSLFEAQRRADPEFGKRSVVLLEAKDQGAWSPGVPHGVSVLRGWAGSARLAEGLSARPAGELRWTIDPPLPRHAFGALALEVPSGGLEGRLVLLGPGLSTEPEELAAFELEITPTAPGRTIALAVGAGDEAGVPVAELRFLGPKPPLAAPSFRGALEPPSILLPGSDHVLDLTAAEGPLVQAWFDPDQLRPNSYRLDMELEAEQGVFDLSVGGTVPGGPPGELRLMPLWLDRTDQWRGPLPGERSKPWAEYLAGGLLRKLSGEVGTRTGRWRLNLYWPGGLEAGTTPWEPIHWSASSKPPSEEHSAP